MNNLDVLKGLINGELVAAMQYKIVADSLIGKENFSYLKDHCEEHYKEEMEHYTSLVTALMEREGFSDIGLSHIVENAIPKTEELTSTETEYVRDFFERSEENAIKAYEEFHKNIEDDADLDDLIIGIIADEKEHKLDFSRLEMTKETEQNQESEREEEFEESHLYMRGLHRKNYSKDFLKFVERLGK